MASTKNRPVELTEQEKNELSLKVFPRLKSVRKVNPLMKILKMANSAVILLFIVACTQPSATAEMVQFQKQAMETPAISMIFKNGLTKADDSREFELNMPDSQLALAAVYKFAKEPTVISISPDVIDYDYERGLLVLLKKDALVTNLGICSNMNLTEEYSSVSLSGDMVLLTGAKHAAIADLKRCAIVKEIDPKDKGLSISEAGTMAITKSDFTIYDRYMSRELYKGTFLGQMFYGQIGQKYILLATDSGKLALMGINDGKYKAVTNTSYKISSVQFVGNEAYVYTEDNKLYRLQADIDKGVLGVVNQAQGKDGCFFLKRSGRLLCDEYIVGTEDAYKMPIVADSGLYSENMLFLRKEGTLFFVDTDPVYRQSIVLGSKGEPQLCLKDGKAYFHDLDGRDRYFTADGIEYKADTYPDKCDHVFEMDEGSVKTPEGNVIYKYAAPVNRSLKAVMLKRIIGQEIYYYFMPVKSSS